MLPISREQVDKLIELGVLKMEKGRYPDLQITSREKKSKRKRYYVPDEFATKYLNN